MRTFALTAFVGMLTAWPATADEAAAGKKLQELKPLFVQRDDAKPGKPITTLILQGEKFGPAEMKLVGELRSLESLTLLGCNMGDADFTDLAQLKNLERFTVGQKMKITDAGLKVVAGLPKLIEVGFSDQEVSPEALTMFTRSPRLKRLEFMQTKLKLEHFKAIAQAKSLEDLTLEFTPIGDDGLKELAGLTNLKILSSRYGTNPITNDGLTALAKFTQLEYLTLEQTKVTGPGLKHLGGMKALKRLDFTGSPIGDESLVHLGKLPALEELFLMDSQITGKGVANLAGAKALYKLYLTHSPIDDAGVAVIAKNPTIRELSLIDTPITDAGLKSLAGMKSLTSVAVDRTRVTAAGVAAFQKANPKIRLQADAK